MRRVITILLLFPLSLWGQNLVPNGSFESISTCPDVNPCEGQIELADDWFSPTTGTLDLFHQCATESFCGIPQGSVAPFHGQGMIGFIISGTTGLDRREYFSIQLMEPLVGDSLYEFGIRMRYPGGNNVAVGSIGVFFAEDSITSYSLDHQLWDLAPQLQRNPNLIMDNESIWYEWIDTLHAQGGEDFLVIGNFLNDSDTPFNQPDWNPTGYYFIDDVRLEKISKPNSVKELDVRFGLLPNPSNGLVSIDYNGNLTPRVMTLLTVEGRQVFSEAWHSQLDVSGFSEGVYLLHVEFDNGAVGTQRLVVQR